MDFADGSAVGGTTPGQVSAVPDLPPPLPALGAGRYAGQGLASLGRGSAGARALDLAETFIDASFSGAKKRAVRLVQHAAAKGPRSWQLRTAVVFLSPWGLQALRLMKPGSSSPPSNSVLPRRFPDA